MEQILLPEHYFEKIRIEAMELIKLHDKDGDMIRIASRKDQKILQIKDAWTQKSKKWKESPSDYANGEMNTRGIKERFGFRKTKASEQPLYPDATIIRERGMAG